MSGAGVWEMNGQSMRLKIAIERYDHHFPFFDNTVVPPTDVKFQVLQVGQNVTLRDGTHRHKRMFGRKEFDVCESPCRRS
jgi:hypothetical protein